MPLPEMQIALLWFHSCPFLLGAVTLPMADVDATRTVEFATVNIEDLIPFPLNPRVHVDEAALLDLKRSIERDGLLEPLIVRPTDSHLFEVVAGNRRLAALQALHEQDPVIWRRVHVRILLWLKGDDDSAFRLAVNENVERESMNPYEETLALLRLFDIALFPEPRSSRPSGQYFLILAGLLKSWAHRVESSREALAKEYSLTVDRVEAAVNSVFKMRDGLKLSSFVNNRLPLLELPRDIQEALAKGEFPYPAAKEVSKVEDPAKRAELIGLASEGMSYRQLIKQAKLMQNPTAEQNDLEESEFIERAKRVSKWLRKKPQLNQNDRRQLDAAFRRIEALFEE